MLAGLLLVLWITQRRLIYLPMTQRVPPPESVLARAEEVEFQTEDGLRLHAWFVPGSKDTTVLVFNGNAGHRAHRAPLAEALSEEGFSILLFDYRGYGGNPGSPSEAGLASDARAARAWLEARPEVDRIAYFGESLGAAVAVGLAKEEPPEALVLRSPFTSLAEVGRVHYPYLPVRLLLWDRYEALDGVGALGVPILVIAGERDGIVPVEQSKAVYEAAREPKRLVVIPGADHNDPELLAGERLIEEVVAFLEEHVP
ncbi:MAG: alpha/beta hydrolase [Acidimicrobiia bacterium]